LLQGWKAICQKVLGLISHRVKPHGSLPRVDKFFLKVSANIFEVVSPCGLVNSHVNILCALFSYSTAGSKFTMLHIYRINYCMGLPYGLMVKIWKKIMISLLQLLASSWSTVKYYFKKVTV
jgi:hypothetical protein